MEMGFHLRVHSLRLEWCYHVQAFRQFRALLLGLLGGRAHRYFGSNRTLRKAAEASYTYRYSHYKSMQ